MTIKYHFQHSTPYTSAMRTKIINFQHPQPLYLQRSTIQSIYSISEVWDEWHLHTLFQNQWEMGDWRRHRTSHILPPLIDLEGYYQIAFINWTALFVAVDFQNRGLSSDSSFVLLDVGIAKIFWLDWRICEGLRARRLRDLNMFKLSNTQEEDESRDHKSDSAGVKKNQKYYLLRSISLALKCTWHPWHIPSFLFSILAATSLSVWQNKQKNFFSNVPRFAFCWSTVFANLSALFPSSFFCPAVSAVVR